MPKKQKDTELKYKLMFVLSKHVGKNNPISMEQLYKEVFGEEPYDKVNATRKIRALVEKCRREGVPISSSQEKHGGGYYLVSGASDLEDYCKRLRRQALRKLALEAKLRKMTLPQLIQRISLNL